MDSIKMVNMKNEENIAKKLTFERLLLYFDEMDVGSILDISDKDVGNEILRDR